ncbi:MrcB family domain-containing protein [Kineosporia sp. A_224]|uniref:MrcB family domain-containing protein n=1 Tax=Kineosporia sp. A_224 TaxID=1962180 RepID=UPI000B4B6A24
MRDLLEDVLLLQSEWTRFNDAPMQQRGHLVRDSCAGWIGERLDPLRSASRRADLDVEGQDGQGNKARVPWVRIFSRELSPLCQPLVRHLGSSDY